MIYSLIQKINVLEGGLEPPQPLWPKDFKSFVSTIPPFEHPFKEERKTASEPSVRLCYSLKTLYFSKSEVVPVCYPHTDGYLPTLTVRLSCRICCKDIFVFRSYKIFFIKFCFPHSIRIFMGYFPLPASACKYGTEQIPPHNVCASFV